MKRKFQVSIEEILRKTVFIEATNEEEARQIADDLYNGEQVVLMPEDITEYNIFIEKEVIENEN